MEIEEDNLLTSYEIIQERPNHLDFKAVLEKYKDIQFKNIKESVWKLKYSQVFKESNSSSHLTLPTDIGRLVWMRLIKRRQPLSPLRIVWMKCNAIQAMQRISNISTSNELHIKEIPWEFCPHLPKWYHNLLKNLERIS